METAPGQVTTGRGETSTPRPSAFSRNVLALGAVSFFTDVSSEMIYPLLPLFLSGVLHASAGFIGVIEGAAESVAALLKLASGWWSDRVHKRKPLVLAGYSLAAVARPLIAIAQSAGQVLAIRVSDRVGKGIRTSPRDALISESVEPSVRGKAFGFHRASDNAGAVLGPLIAFFVLREEHVNLRTIFWLASIPGIIAVIVLAIFVRDRALGSARAGEVPASAKPKPSLSREGIPRRFWVVLGVIFLFTLGNSTDAFLLLRAAQLGVPVYLAPILWVVLHIVKASSNTPGGALSDRVGRKPVIVAGWLWYAGVYFLFARANAAWQAWALFALYGIFYGLTEGSEGALVADLVPKDRRGVAYGWFNLAIGLGALPASWIFGVIWDRAGSGEAFLFGATVALVAAIGMLLLVRVPTADEVASSAAA